MSETSAVVVVGGVGVRVECVGDCEAESSRNGAPHAGGHGTVGGMEPALGRLLLLLLHARTLRVGRAS
jgi:hypothetical protein